MKKLTSLFLFFLFLQTLSAQVNYYRGEWTEVNSTELFSCICKITFPNETVVKGELVWCFLAADSTDNIMMDTYKGKKGKMAIEFVSGTQDMKNNDIYFDGAEKKDPQGIIGLDKYTLKVSADKMTIYGKSWSNGKNNGLFYAVKLDAVEGEKMYKAALKLIPD